jgi:hypothetical protein
MFQLKQKKKQQKQQKYTATLQFSHSHSCSRLVQHCELLIVFPVCLVGVLLLLFTWKDNLLDLKNGLFFGVDHFKI